MSAEATQIKSLIEEVHAVRGQLRWLLGIMIMLALTIGGSHVRLLQQYTKLDTQQAIYASMREVNAAVIRHEDRYHVNGVRLNGEHTNE